MSIESLTAHYLDDEAVTPVTPSAHQALPLSPLSCQSVTPATQVTSGKILGHETEQPRFNRCFMKSALSENEHMIFEERVAIVDIKFT